MGVDDEFEEMRKVIDRMLQDALGGKLLSDGEPRVRGFVRRPSSRGQARRTQRRVSVPVPRDPPSPEPDVTVRDREMYVTLDLGERSPTAIRTYVSGRLLLVEVDGSRPLRQLVQLPGNVEPEVSWTLRNGVLDVVLARRAGPIKRA